MKIRLVSLMAVCGVGMLLTGCAPKTGTFGDPMQKADMKPMSVATVLAHGDMMVGQETRVEGTVHQVCDGAGCWMEIADMKDAKKKLFVKFTYDRSVGGRVPVSAVGHHAICEGKIASIEIPEEMRAHYARESGKSVNEVPEKQLQLLCCATEIEGVKPAAAQACDRH